MKCFRRRAKSCLVGRKEGIGGHDTGTILRWLWQSGGGPGSVGDGGLAAAGWAEQEWQAGARALAGDVGRDRSKAKQRRMLLTGGMWLLQAAG